MKRELCLCARYLFGSTKRTLLFLLRRKESRSRGRKRKKIFLHPFLSFFHFSSNSSCPNLFKRFEYFLIVRQNILEIWNLPIPKIEMINIMLSRSTTLHALKRKVHFQPLPPRILPVSPAAKLEATTSPSQFVFSILERNRISISQGRLITVEPTRVPRFTTRHVIRASSNTAV